MEETANMAVQWPFLLFAALALFTVFLMLAGSWLLGERHMDRRTAEPYESGIIPTGVAGGRFEVRYYMVGLLFLIFDLEAAFLFTWAVAVRETGWTGFIEAVIFILILVAALVFLWARGALETGGLQGTRGIKGAGGKSPPPLG